MFFSRTSRPGRFFEWKVRIFTVASVLALCGIYFEERWMSGAAIGVLLIALVLRLIPDGRVTDTDPADEEHVDSEVGREGEAD